MRHKCRMRYSLCQWVSLLTSQQRNVESLEGSVEGLSEHWDVPLFLWALFFFHYNPYHTSCSPFNLLPNLLPRFQFLLPPSLYPYKLFQDSLSLLGKCLHPEIPLLTSFHHIKLLSPFTLFCTSISRGISAELKTMTSEFSGGSLEDLIYLFLEAPDHEKKNTVTMEGALEAT